MIRNYVIDLKSPKKKLFFSSIYLFYYVFKFFLFFVVMYFPDLLEASSGIHIFGIWMPPHVVGGMNNISIIPTTNKPMKIYVPGITIGKIYCLLFGHLLILNTFLQEEL